MISIFVSNIPFKANEEDLEELFNSYDVKSIKIIRDGNSGQSKGYGFVEMANREEGERAIKELDGQDMMGRPLRVNEARSREERKPKETTPQKGKSDQKQEKQQPPRKKPKSNSKDYFHNPYTFIPTPSRQDVKGFAGDYNPLKSKLNHAHLKQNTWTGHIPIKITTVTPLVLLKTGEKDNNDEDDNTPEKHQKHDVHSRIPEPSLRGVLRSAYEVVTNSRYSSFRNDDRLAYRMETDSAKALIPAIIKNGKVVLYPGTSKVTAEGPDGALYGAMLTLYKRDHEQKDLRTLCHNNYKPKTGDEVWAEILLCQHRVSNRGSHNYTDDFKFYKAIKIWNKSDIPKEPNKTKESIYPDGVPDTHPGNRRSYYVPVQPEVRRMVKGYVMITNQNMGNKHDERIFFNPISDDFKVTKVLEDAWRMRIQSYRKAHSESDIFYRKNAQKKPWKYIDKQPGKTAWSPHQYQDNGHRDIWNNDPHKRSTTHDASELKDGTMAYARCEIDDSTGDIRKIKDLFPVMISRELYECSPKALLNESLQPAKELEQLSPADRLFGWITQESNGIGGYKSRIRVVCEDSESSDVLENFKSAPIPLSILGEPKPEQGRFYVAADGEGKPQKGIDKKEAGYKKDGKKQLRGRKQYWHHKGLEKENAPNYWKNPIEDRTKKLTDGRIQEYRRPDKYNNKTRQMEMQTDTQNRSIKGWIKPDEKFKASLYVQNLEPEEVGALLWLLTLPEHHYYKLGYGKPLGFGSVRIEIDTEQLPLGNDENWKEYYANLDDTPPKKLNKEKQKEFIEQFKKCMIEAYQQQNFDKLPFIQGFLKVLRGPDENYPIHYPRKDEERNEEGKNFEWFMANEHYGDGKRLGLPDVNAEDQKLPYTPSEPKRKRR